MSILFLKEDLGPNHPEASHEGKEGEGKAEGETPCTQVFQPLS